MKSILASLAFFLATMAQGQNLVPNGGFEDYTLCPTSLGQVERAVGWSVASGSPDYFNGCSANDSMDVPMNIVGYQAAYEGQGYAGGATYLQGAPSVRECFQHALSSPLIPGMPVFLSMMVSPGGFGSDPNNNSIRFASSGIGIKFSMQAETTGGLWPGNVAMHLTSALIDTANWLQVSGVYIPDSAYTNVAIGCFLPDTELVIEELDPAGQWNAAYAFVDNVCVSFTAADCPLAIGIQQEAPSMWNAGSNPVGNQLSLRLNGAIVREASLTLIDGSGRQCRSELLQDATTNVDWSLNNLADGFYSLQLRTAFGHFWSIQIFHVNP